jgi:hypothetical protein
MNVGKHKNNLRLCRLRNFFTVLSFSSFNLAEYTLPIPIFEIEKVPPFIFSSAKSRFRFEFFNKSFWSASPDMLYSVPCSIQKNFISIKKYLLKIQCLKTVLFQENVGLTPSPFRWSRVSRSHV